MKTIISPLQSDLKEEQREMSDVRKPREFPCGEQRWRVKRFAAAQQSKQTNVEGPPPKRTGLYFECGDVTRFLAFTRGAMPSENDLNSMSDEVLCVLLRRAKLE